MRHLLLALAAGLALALPAAAQDVAGSADHPLVGRFAGSVINAYQTHTFDEVEIAVGPTAGGDGADRQEVEGATTRIAYTLSGDHSLAEVARNYEQALAGKGFQIVFACETKDCGGVDFAHALETLPLPQMIVDAFNFRYLAAKLPRPEGDVTVAVVMSVDTQKRVRIEVTVVELQAMEFQMVDAAAMEKALGEKGSVALYGIYFDTDRAEIKPELAPTLAEMAKFLAGAPDITVVVVGHTDNEGEMDYNLDLSHRRAQAVVDALVENHGIARDRLIAAGAGFLAPVAPNDTEAGRAKNRRVEMIPR